MPILALHYRCLSVFVGNAQVGDGCSVSEDVGFAGCEDGAYCESGVCESYVPSGGSCTGIGEQCNWPDGESCLDDLACGPRRAEGEACTSASDCLSGHCVAALCAAPDEPLLCGYIND